MDVSRRHLVKTGLGAVAGIGLGTTLAGGTGLLGETDEETANVLVAGSLAGVAADTPGASIEAHGSLAARRLLLNGGRDPDAVALADPTLFAGLADEVTLFATNALVVAYNPDSEFAAAIEDDWATALARGDLRLGRTDPSDDPLGYRTVMAMRLAGRRGLADPAVLDGSQVLPETALVQNVELGKLDAAFAYRSMAREHDLPAVSLPASIDFSDPGYADEYASVSLALPETTVRGAPIRYGVAALTETGREWTQRLATGTERLAAHGFSTPADYPRAVGVAERPG